MTTISINVRRPHCFSAIRNPERGRIWASRRLTYAEGAGQASAQRVLCVFLMGELLLWFSFCFLCSGAQHQQTRTKTKKRWGPALGLWQGLVALARAKLRKQQLKIRLHKEKQKRQSKHRTNKSKCIAQSRKSKSRMQKKKQ